MGKQFLRVGKVGWQLLTSVSPRNAAGRRPAKAPRPGIELLELRDLPAAVANPTYFLFHNAGDASPLNTSGPTGTSPSAIKQAYGFNQISFQNGTVVGDGTGTTIAIVDAYDDPNIANDLHQFDVRFGLPDPTFTKINQNGGSSLPSPNSGWIGEIALDVQWAHAIAPGAKILLVEANSNGLNDLLTAVRTAASYPGVVTVSMSWAGGESSGERGYDGYFTTPSGHAGVSFFASSGDSGAPALYPAASVNVVSVGGTTLNLNGSGNIVSETAWSGSGGGLSSFEPQPSYQNGVVTQSSTQRATPDVAYDADPQTGFPVYDSYNNGTSAPWVQYGGTSAAAPQWAALVAIADQGRLLAGLGSLDGGTQLLPMLYRLPSSDFHDITSGTTTGSPNLSAGPGYDLTSGRGSPFANLIVNDLVGPVVPPATPTNLAATAVASDQIQLTWTAVTFATGYLIERSPDGQTGWTQVSTALGTSTALLTDGGLTPGATYYYRIRAYNSFGNSNYSNVANTTTLAGTVSNLFADNFDSSAAGPAWKFVGGSWAQSGGVMQQTSTANGDPRKAMVTNQTFPADVVITARVRVDSWSNGDYARAGVGLYTNTANGQGYNLLFHNNTSTVQFLDDAVKWGNSYTFSWQVGTWYWFKLEEQGGVLYGKIWADGTAEPAAWLFTQSGWTDRLSSGAPALNGGDTGTGGSTASFDAVSVASLGTPPATAPGNFTATAAGAHQINLAWSDVTGEAGFKVERSADGQTGWTQVGTVGTGVLAYSDTGLSASTTYYYRVRATNAAGDGPYSAVAQATTGAPSLPGTPTSLTATAVSSSQINLSWPDVSGESGFKVERSPDGQTGWAQIGTTATGVLTYSDNGLSAGTTYYYRVRGTNADGDGGYSPVANATTLSGVLFSDDFSGSSINSAWKFVGGNWSQANGALSQTSTANGDPRKAMVTNQTFPADVVITARVRVDSWTNGDYARAGVGLYTDPNTGLGYNLVFHNNTNTVQFLNDHVAWGNAYTFSWQVGTWYWFELQEQGGVLYGKIWADGTTAPTSWMFQQSGWSGRSSSGAPALNGGDTGTGGSTASFDDVSVGIAGSGMAIPAGTSTHDTPSPTGAVPSTHATSALSSAGLGGFSWWVAGGATSFNGGGRSVSHSGQTQAAGVSGYRHTALSSSDPSGFGSHARDVGLPISSITTDPFLADIFGGSSAGLPWSV